MIFLKFKGSILCTVFFAAMVLGTLPLFAEDKTDTSFSEREITTIKKFALEALLELSLIHI